MKIKTLLFIIFLLGFINHTFYAQDTVYCGKNKILICHKEKNTLCVSINAVQAHLDHGDYLGSCRSIECGVSARGGVITCKDTIVTLVAISDTTGVTYSWSGPNNFTSSLDSPSTHIPGIYIVIVTDTVNGCTASDSAIVSKDTLAPGAAAEGGVITCTNTLATLSGSSGTSGAIFKWVGPENYASTQQNAVTSVPGEYILSVTNPLNGCISGDTIIIQQNNTVPGDATATAQDTLTCTRTSVTLTGSSNTSSVTYNWYGPNGFNSTEQSPIVTAPGIYKLVVTDPGNGCSSSANTMVEQNVTPPSDVIATVSGILTCIDTTVTLSGSSSSSSVTYNWLDPNSFNFSGNSAIVSIPGTYILTVTNINNGCSESSGVTVEQNIAVPGNFTATASDTLSCTVTNVVLSASSTTNCTNYQWTGPQGFISNEQNTVTVLPGNYDIAASNQENGCTSVKQVTVIKED